MIEAWLVIPAIALTYLLASSTSLWTRILRLAGMVVVTAAVSLSWMLFVTLTPSAQRPYVDGSQHDSVFEQVFGYNGFGRVGTPSPNAELGRTLHIPVLATPPPHPAWNRLLTGSYGLDTGWLIPASVVVVVAGLWSRRRRPRTDPVRAGIVLWGTWLLVFGAFLSTSPSINSYYLAALCPAVAGLLGIGCELAWVDRRALGTRIAVVSAVLVSSVYAYWLLPGSGTGLPGWLAPAVLAFGIAAAALIVAVLVLRDGDAAIAPGLMVAAAAMIVVPAVATASVIANTLGAFDTPFQPTAVTAFTRSFFGAPLSAVSTLPRIEATRNGAPDLMATETSVLAAPFIYATGQEVLPIGGYTGTAPSPTVSTLRSMVASGRFHLVLAGAASTDDRITWIASRCLLLPPTKPPTPAFVRPLAIYFCAGPHHR
jgi:4-amino-4-deoxy-L-arabinose transferase-like glycosyltransferase